MKKTEILRFGNKKQFYTIKDTSYRVVIYDKKIIEQIYPKNQGAPDSIVSTMMEERMRCYKGGRKQWEWPLNGMELMNNYLLLDNGALVYSRSIGSQYETVESINCGKKVTELLRLTNYLIKGYHNGWSYYIHDIKSVNTNAIVLRSSKWYNGSSLQKLQLSFIDVE